jgi:hypothetical protein
VGNDVFFSKGSKTPRRFWSFWMESTVMVRFRDRVRVRGGMRVRVRCLVVLDGIST